MKIGYARVSTDEQILDLQMDALKAAGCDVIHTDTGISGSTVERDGLSKALAAVQDGDVLVVWRLDRLGRSLAFLIDLIARLGERKAGFQSLTEAIDTTTAGGRLVFHMMGALAEFERSLIAERTREGMKAAKRRGKHVGRPPALSAEQVAFAKRTLAAGEETISGLASILGVDRSTLRRSLTPP
ncbi:recombinase family protein [Sinorhizobium medicae]|uniref:recombinase family protein n=1 Tax=Sinorhizobium medicae TaxID=110321 RepID=UPI000C79F145|nr:recombinase family protein [Sinorhizobium medicae]PLU25722.1 DNA resolvase [Sinorhizobium medicae]